MPAFLEKELKREYPNNPHAVYGTMNKIGAMHGNKETAKGAEMQMKHEKHLKAHAIMRGHGGVHAASYAHGAMNERHGAHRNNHARMAASGHGYSGKHADAYMAGAKNEADGLHAMAETEPDADDTTETA